MAAQLQQLAWDILNDNYTVGPTTAPPFKTVPKAWKLGMLPALFLSTLVPSIGPWFMLCLCSRRNLALSFSFAGCLAAGILLGAGLGNILPEANENWRDYFEQKGISGRVSGFPFASAIAGIVLLLLVSLEHLLISAGANHSHGPDDESDEEPPGEETPIMRAHKEAKKKKKKKKQTNEAADVIERKDKKEMEVSQGNGRGELMPEHSKTKAGHRPHEHVVPEWHDSQGHHHHQRRVITVAVFSIAFCLHGLADGLALGATNERSAFISLAAAAFSHKFLDGFALGVPVQKAELKLAYSAALLCLASAMTPAGVVIGMALTSANATSSYLARAIILSFSFGSFLFLSLLELLPQSLAAPRKHRVLKLVFVFCGFIAMSALATLEDRSLV